MGSRNAWRRLHDTLKYVAPGVLLIVVSAVLYAWGISSWKGFADLGALQQRADAFAAPFDSQHGLSQSFMATEPDLSRVVLSFHNLHPDRPRQQGRIFISLQDASRRNLASDSWPIAAGAQDFDISFSFPPQSQSQGQQYILQLTTDAPPDTVSAWASSYDTYPDGALTINGVANDGDLNFVAYEVPAYSSLIRDSLFGAPRRLGVLLLLSIVYFALGSLVCILLLASHWASLPDALGSALGIGIAIPPIAFFLFNAVRIPIVPYSLLVLLGVLAALAIVRGRTAWRGLLPAQTPWAEISILGLMFIGALVTRLIQVQQIFVPNWIDGLFHQRFIAEMLQDARLPAGSVYHLGFHSNAIVTKWLTGLAVPQASLLYGQWLSAVSGLCFYPVARRLFSDSRVALIITGLYWFVAPFPAYLVTWARYPYLQGVVLLPTVVALCLPRKVVGPSRVALLAILLLGLLLSHYGVFGLAVILVFMSSLVYLQIRRIGWNPARLAGGMVLGVLVAVVIGEKALRALDAQMWALLLAKLHQATPGAEALHFVQLMLQQGGILILALGGIGALMAWFADRHFLLVVSAWALLSIAGYAIQDQLLGVSAFGIPNGILFLTIPLCLLCGFPLQYLFRSGNATTRWAIGLAAVLLLLEGSYHVSSIINPETVLFTPADQSAMKWIAANTARSQKFLIDSFVWWGHYQPADGGAWIPYLAGRRTAILSDMQDPATVEEFAARRKISYVYLGRGNGDLDPYVINNPHFRLVYENDGVRIYQVVQTAAGGVRPVAYRVGWTAGQAANAALPN